MGRDGRDSSLPVLKVLVPQDNNERTYFPYFQGERHCHEINVSASPVSEHNTGACSIIHIKVFAIGLLTKQGITLVCISLSLKKSQVFYKIFAHLFDKFYVYKYTCFGKVLSRLHIITKRTKTKEQRTVNNTPMSKIFAWS